MYFAKVVSKVQYHLPVLAFADRSNLTHLDLLLQKAARVVLTTYGLIVTRDIFASLTWVRPI